MSTSASASLHLVPSRSHGAMTSTGAPALNPHGLRPEPGSRGSHRPGHIHLAPPQPDHRPDMTWRRAATTGGTGSGRVTPSVGQTQSCKPSQPTPHSLSRPTAANTPEQGGGLLRPQSHHAAYRRPWPPSSRQSSGEAGRWTCSTGPPGKGRQAWPLRGNGPPGSLEQVGPNVVQTLSPQSDRLEPCWAQEDGEQAPHQSRGRKEDSLGGHRHHRTEN